MECQRAARGPKKGSSHPVTSRCHHHEDIKNGCGEARLFTITPHLGQPSAHRVDLPGGTCYKTILPRDHLFHTPSENYEVPRSNERRKELKRRRHRKKKMVVLRRKLESATTSGKAEIISKIRSLTPGADQMLTNLGLDEK
ncbi:MAG: DUF6800 family protein [Pirellulaceae bacterium]